MELGPGDEIVVPGFTCTVVPNAMIYRGIRPVYADVDPVTFNADPDCVERAITPRTRVIYLQHTFGVACDVERLRAIAARHGLRTIEDLAHSLGATVDGRPHGAFGDAAFFSTDRTTVVNTHLGGCAVTSDEAIAARLGEAQRRAVALGPLASRLMVWSFLADVACRDPALFWIGRPALGALRRAGASFTWSDEPWNALPEGYPYPSRMVPALARVGLSQLARLGENLAHRRAIAQWLEARIGWYGQRLAETGDVGSPRRGTSRPGCATRSWCATRPPSRRDWPGESTSGAGSRTTSSGGSEISRPSATRPAAAPWPSALPGTS
jgi:dTDP-4-amino-4,6-dideoxygalactose transaminase